MHATSGTHDKARAGDAFPTLELTATCGQLVTVGGPANELGVGHGRSQTSRALTRHARLAFNTGSAVAEFLLDTSHQRRGDEAAQEHPSTPCLAG